MPKIAIHCAVLPAILFAVAGMTPPTVFAAHTPAAPQADKHVQIDLLSSPSTITAGGTTTIGIRFKIEAGWHIYWDGLNDTGFAPIITWKTPAGVEIAPLEWPTPKRHIAEGDILDHVYEQEVILLTKVTVPTTATPGDITIEAAAKWLVCKDACIAESGTTSSKLTVVATKSVLPPETTDSSKAIDAARKTVPTPLLPEDGIKARIAGDVLLITDPQAAEMSFFPRSGFKIPADPIRECMAKSTELKISLRAPDGEDPSTTINGILSIKRKDGTTINRDLSIPVKAAVEIPTNPGSEIPIKNPHLVPTEPSKKKDPFQSPK